MTKILLFGEPLIRISPLDATSIGDHVASSTYFGGSEINIACNLQALGISTKVFTALPANEIGDRFLTFLKQHQIDTVQSVGLAIESASTIWRTALVVVKVKFSTIVSIRVSARFGQTC